MAALLRSLLKSMGLLLAAGVIIAATLVCASRLLTPVLNQHRAEFERYASELLHAPVTITQVRASWHQYQPEIGMEGVTIYDPASHQPILQIQELDVFVSLVHSIWQRQFVMGGIMVSGTALNINADKEGNLSLQGFPQFDGNSTPYENQTQLSNVLGWLAQNQRIILHDIDVHYTGVNKESRYVTLHDLSLSNAGDDHTIVGTATLHQKLPTKLTLAAQWDGKTLDPKQITGRAYVYASGLDLSQWFKGLKWQGWQVNQGVISNKIWLEWKQGELQKAQMMVQAYGLELYSDNDNSLHTITRLSGNFGWKRQDKMDVIAGEDILVDLPQHLWPVSSFYISMQPDKDGVMQPQMINVGYINLADARRFLVSSALLDKTQREWLRGLQLNGNLQNTSVSFGTLPGDYQHVSFNTAFSQLNFSEYQNIPGVANLNGTIKWDGLLGEGDASLAGTQTGFEYTKIFDNEIPLETINGAIHIQRAENNIWHFSFPKLSIVNDDVNALVSGTLIAPPGSAPIIDMKGDFSLQHAEHIAAYLPMKIFDKDLTDWIRQSIQSGSVQSGHAELHGLLSEFPFDGGNGTFLISGMANDVSLHYAPGWPDLNHVYANVVFSGRQVKVDASQAKVMDIPIGEVHAQIPYMGAEKPTILTVAAQPVDTDLQQGFKFVEASPLQDSIGKMFAGMELDGPIKLDLGLTIPLNKPEDTHVLGNINMRDAKLDMTPWGLTVDHVNGALQFTEDSTTASGIHAQLFNKPLQFSLATMNKGKSNSFIEADFSSSMAITDLQKWLRLPFDQVVKGAADVSGKIAFSLKDPMELRLNSQLKGIAVNLPDNYGKKAEEARDFAFDLTVPEKQPLKLMINYGKTLSAAILMSNKNNQFKLTAADLHLGTGDAAWPDSPGLYVTGNFKTVDWAAIQSYLNQASGSTSLPISDIPLSGAEIQADQINIGALTLSQMRIQMTAEKDEWIVALDSPDITGQIQIPKNFNAKEKLVADFTHLNLRTTETEAAALVSSIRASTLPSIEFAAERMSFNSKFLGKISFKTTPGPNGLMIRNLGVNSSRISLRAAGKWVQTKDVSKTQLQGVLESSKVGEFLGSLGYDTHNFIVNDGKLNFNIGWNGAPYAFALKNLTGSASLNLGKGRIADIGQESTAKMDLGRMLSIFSLQTIPRRLSLDFSDMFERGYSFDNVRGDVTLKNGSIYTHNFKFNGPVAMVGINGRIGLSNKDYDFTLIVTPYVTSSIPIAAALLGGPYGPFIGLAAFAVNTVIGPSLINKATTYYYSVTGPWGNPSWKTVSLNQRGRY